ncbi:MAG: transglutaminase family protein, partial [Mycobacteriaceae bacterium]|nr:transglutaminase family protein [Mycobacteriaceae bacterium]MBY0406280.1 transglutaminase family protein [Rickettsiales bacterium]
MAITAAIHHVTRYTYDRPVSMGMQTIRLRPPPHTRSHVQSYSLEVSPTQHFINWQQDPFGNYLARVVFPEKIREFCVTVDLITEIRVFNPFDFFLEDYASHFPFTYEETLAEELTPYLETKESGPLLQSLLAEIPREKIGMVDFLVHLNHTLNQRLKYLVRMEPGVQTCEETLANASGSCRDMAWLLCQVLRHLGLASRFASGYLVQLKADEKSLDGPSGTEVDFTDLHAWCEVYLPGAGWIGLDPTSGLFTGEGHIPLCCTPSPISAAPISGTHEAASAKLHHTMRVTRIHEPPRVTKPYTDHAWEQIETLAEKIDEDIARRDIRLTMGGEPTFVSIDDRESDQWNFTALGEEKAELGKALFARLCARFAEGGLQQYTQGKWYPGEILPRWAMNAYWRTDAERIWENAALLADPMQSYGHTLGTAKAFINALAEALAIPDSYVIPAHEDVAYYLWKEARLPIAGDILKAENYEKTERERLQRLMDQNLKKEVGYVLPLAFSPTRQGWISNRWKFTHDRLQLLPGDSPVG